MHRDASEAEQPRAEGPGRLVRVLDVDPDLGVGLSEAERPRAQSALVAHAYDAQPGPWHIREPTREQGAFGLLVIDGLLALRTTIDGRATLELVGRGDVLQPWVQLGAETTVPPGGTWEVLEPSQLALLDRRFSDAVGGFPEVTANLMYRLVLRSRRLCYQLAVNSSPRAEDRVLYALWALADRWGRMTEDGVVLELRLTHQQIGELVCAQRPSVSAALNRLREEGRVSYSRGSFVLYGDTPRSVDQLKQQVALKA